MQATLKDKNLLTRVRTRMHRSVIGLIRLYYNAVWGTKIAANTRISLSAKLDKVNPSGIVIGENTAVAFKVAILTHDFVHGQHHTTRIGSNCFIGAGSIIMAGVTIGDQCIVGAGSVVMKNVPSNSVVLGNPARVLEKGIKTGPFGRRLDQDPPTAGSPE